MRTQHRSQKKLSISMPVIPIYGEPGDIIPDLEYQYSTEDIDKYMLLHQQGGSEYAQGHQYGDRKVPAWCLFHAQGCVDAAPAFQTMDGRKEIHRRIHLIDQAYQLLTDAISSDFRANQCGRQKQEKSETEQLGDHISVDKMIAKAFSFPGNQQIIGDPLNISQNIENDKRGKERDLVINRQRQRMKGQMVS